MGGTFDVLHLGHVDLLRKSFEIGSYVVIGLTSDEFAKYRLKKNLRNTFETRLKNLKTLILNQIRSTSFEITKLEEEFGPLMFSEYIDCLVVSSETSTKGEKINKIRSEKGLLPIDIIIVKMRLAEDGLPISSTRIKAKEIDPEGRILDLKK
ncbi:Phosphopantetheine adenylyltransferase [Candidatus Nitrosocosmicus franklandus]|uniref:Phosphopantetheine adenylyltransferase n=2 Tax=Candidatus Nitrosocosmicus franklandianus TaxID=1798806 RepID=A0A484ICP8_9ARCH|nr:Phosphopantetheine adenylyltransferase [Candidatus Nitrosocosmicus franklandus]